MNPLMYVIPVAIIIAIVVIMMPIMKKKAAAANAVFAEMKDKKVLLFVQAGQLHAVNEVNEALMLKSNNIFAIDEDGPLSIELTPSFTFHNTLYTGTDSMRITFEATAGSSYEIKAENKEPKNDPTVVDVSPVTGNELIFKSKFYIVTRDITDTDQAKFLRGTA